MVVAVIVLGWLHTAHSGNSPEKLMGLGFFYLARIYLLRSTIKTPDQ